MVDKIMLWLLSKWEPQDNIVLEFDDHEFKEMQKYLQGVPHFREFLDYLMSKNVKRHWKTQNDIQRADLQGGYKMAKYIRSLATPRDEERVEAKFKLSRYL